VGVDGPYPHAEACLDNLPVGPDGGAPAGGANVDQVVFVIGIVQAEFHPAQNLIAQLRPDLVLGCLPVRASADDDLDVLVSDAQPIQFVDQRQGH